MRDWLAIYTRMLGKPKYRRLSIAARAALFHTWLLAGSQTPEATWSSRAHLEEILELDGYPTDVVAELVARGWLDENDRRIVVHDWDDHQLAATRDARLEYERDRKREWRRRRDSLPPDPSLSDTTPQHTSPQVSQSVPDTSRTPKPETEPPTRRRHVNNGARPRLSEDERTTCPECGDAVLDSDPGVVVVNVRGQLGHHPGTCTPLVPIEAVS